MDRNWLYKDDSGNEQGPHSGVIINAWFASGFFDKDRLVKHFPPQEGDEWIKIGDVEELVKQEEQGEEVQQEQEESNNDDDDDDDDVIDVIDDQSMWLYLDDEGNPQGPYSYASICSWYKSGFFDKERQVKMVQQDQAHWRKIGDIPALMEERKNEDAPPQAQSEYEAYLNEYYKNYYEQYYSQQVADYEEKMREYEEAVKIAEMKKEGKLVAPDDGYVMPKPEFKEYTVKGMFDKVKGRFMAEGTGGSEYWAWQGLQGDKEGRQLDHYYDVDAFAKAQAAGMVVGNKPDKKKAKKEKKVVPAWMEEDPLEGAYRTK